MLNIIGHRKVWFGISGALLLASIVAIAVWGLRLGIDFTGGSILELKWTGDRPAAAAIEEAVKPLDLGTISVQPAEGNVSLVRTKSLDEEGHQKLVAALDSAFRPADSSSSAFDEISFESIGPTIGNELRQKSYGAIALVLAAIIIYIAFAFRKVSQPVASWKYGVCAVIALFHDVTIPTGIFAILGHYLGYEVDTLFVTAILTVLGFSVHDTIVVFDRIRENLIKHSGKTFEETINTSVNETVTRSINTSLTVLLVLLSVYLFGGESTKNFVLVLILGILFGTYSSIFIASPLLLEWHDRFGRRK